MKEKIIKRLLKEKLISDWIIREIHRGKTESYFVGVNPEYYRTVETRYCVLTTFVRHKGKLGYTNVRINSDDPASIDKAIQESLFIANSVSNPDFQLPSPENYIDIDLVDDEIISSSRKVHSRNHDELRRINANLPSYLGLASAELHLEKRTTSLESSSGINVEQDETMVIFDIVLVSETSRGESEQLLVIKKRKYNDINIDDAIKINSQYAHDKTFRNIPSTTVLPVIINAAELRLLLNPIISHASMTSELKGYSRFKEGERLFKGNVPEPITLIADATIRGGVGSTRFDEFGTPGKKAVIIQEGIFKNRWGPHDVACWLNKHATGALGNVVLEPGHNPRDNLFHGNNPLLQVVEFSDLVPNQLTGDFMGEIRMGYWYEKGEKIPVTGGAVSGNVFEMFKSVTSSRETVIQENYHGPQVARFEDLQFTGSS